MAEKLFEVSRSLLFDSVHEFEEERREEDEGEEEVPQSRPAAAAGPSEVGIGMRFSEMIVMLVKGEASIDPTSGKGSCTSGSAAVGRRRHEGEKARDGGHGLRGGMRGRIIREPLTSGRLQKTLA